MASFVRSTVGIVRGATVATTIATEGSVTRIRDGTAIAVPVTVATVRTTTVLASTSAHAFMDRSSGAAGAIAGASVECPGHYASDVCTDADSGDAGFEETADSVLAVVAGREVFVVGATG